MIKQNFQRLFFICTLILAPLILVKSLGTINPPSPTNPPDEYLEAWEQVDNFMKNGLPQSALKVVDSIFILAKKDLNSPQIVKCIIHQLKFKDQREEDAFIASIQTIKQEINNSEAPLKNVLHSTIAELYWWYYQNDKWRILKRTSLSENDTNNDLKTWDLKRIAREIQFHYKQSLVHSESLKNIPTSHYKAVIVPGRDVEELRPTLFDFLAHRAIDFYTHGEAGMTQNINQFKIDEPEYIRPYDEFLKFSIPKADDSLSFFHHALVLLQDLTRLHENNASALMELEIQRIKFVHSNYSGTGDKDLLYEQSLSDLIAKFDNKEESAIAAYHLAQLYSENGNKYDFKVGDRYQWEIKKAYDLCQEYVNKFPNSFGANYCKDLQTRILSKSMGLSNPKVVTPNKPSLAYLNYKNIKTLHLRLVKLNDIRAYMYQRKTTEEWIAFYNSLEKIKDWKLQLPTPGDYQEHSTEIEIPGLPVGRYVILICDDGNFNVNSNYKYNEFQVSVISFLTRDYNDENREFHLRHRITGVPLKKVKASIYHQSYDYNDRKNTVEFVKDVYSNDEGILKMNFTNDRNNFHVLFTHQNDTLSTKYPFSNYAYRKNRDWSNKQTQYYTDRKIYRPGQTVYFKGIRIESNQDGHRIVPNETVIVKFTDVNFQEVSTLTLKTNEFGTFNGSFIAPNNGLNGRMHITDIHGSTSFQVEEYKRPKFEVIFNPVKGSYRINEMVQLTGNVKSFSGVNLNDAKINYRIVRNTSYHRLKWNWFGYFPTPQTNYEVKQGDVICDKNGVFTIDFKAIGDALKSDNYYSSYSFTIYVNATDIAGETQSNSKTIQVSQKSMLLQADIDENINQLDPLKFKVRSTNLNYEVLPTKVRLQIHSLKPAERLIRNPEESLVDLHSIKKEEFVHKFPYDKYDQVGNEKGNLLLDTIIQTSDSSFFLTQIHKNWKLGNYLMTLSATDNFGENVELSKEFTLLNSSGSAPAEPSFLWTHALKNKAEPGESIPILLSTTLKKVNVIYEIEHDNKIVHSEQIILNNEQKKIIVQVKEEYRGNFTVHFKTIRENAMFGSSYQIIVPYSNKKLDISFTTFRDQLLPGQKEEWTIKIKGPKGDAAQAELVTAMYDASLDQFISNNWGLNIYASSHMNKPLTDHGNFGNEVSSILGNGKNPKFVATSREFERLNWFGYTYYDSRHGYYSGKGVYSMAIEEEMAEDAIFAGNKNLESIEVSADKASAKSAQLLPQPGAAPPSEKLENVKIRSNFNETAFFYPDLKTDAEGNLLISFTIPESLTKWKLLGLAHTKDLKIGQFEKEVITKKKLMVTTNPPRFFREGDSLVMKVKVSNLQEEKASGLVTISFKDAFTEKDLTPLLMKSGNLQQDITIDSNESKDFAWKIHIPEGYSAISYTVSAAAGDHSDGERIVIPVLTNRMLVTESIPFNVRGTDKKKISFDKLKNSDNSTTLRHERLTLEYTANPAWYAVQALPYLMEYPYECAEQTFSRYYANSIASHIANSSPKLKTVFDSWKNQDSKALLSNLEKNQELKSLLLEETPWVLEAKDESERKRRIALLFDLNTIGNQLSSAIRKLEEMQLPNGAWPWFKGMHENRYITQHIITGIGHLYHLGIKDRNERDESYKVEVKAINYLDNKITEDYNWLKSHNVDLSKRNISSSQIQYLYARSFFGQINISETNREAYDYYLGQAEKYWLNESIYMQGMLALVLHRSNKTEIAKKIIASLKERSLKSEEFGMYWKPNSGYFWHNAPIERQALLIEVFHEVAKDKEAVEEMKIWLLKQKQTQDWKTTKATSEACYSLLLQGTDLLQNKSVTTFQLGSETVSSNDKDLNAEEGTGYFKKTWSTGEINSKMGDISIKRTAENKEDNTSISWGAVYWQYFEQLDKITTHSTPLNIKKQLYVLKNTKNGPELLALSATNKVNVGDIVVVRIELRVDREMEFVHMKDMRASGFEPINVISGYHYQDGLGYYESTKDASTNFFFDRLQKGTYVFEYNLKANISGDFSNGITTIQCMYAPEFTSHSEGVRVNIAR